MDMIDEAIESYKQSLSKIYDDIHNILCFLFLLICNGSIDEVFVSLDYIIKRNKNEIVRYYKYLKRKKKNGKTVHFDYNEEPNDFNDLIDDYPMDEKLITEITSTLLRVLCIRGEMSYICGDCYQARKDYRYLKKKNYEFDSNNFLYTMMNSTSAANMKMVSDECLEEVNMFVTMKQPTYGTYHRSLRSPDYWFNNIEESIFFISSFIYKYQMLFIQRDENFSLELILSDIRTEYKRSLNFMLYPYVLIGLVRIYIKSDSINTPISVMDSFYESDQKHNLMNLFNFIDERIESLIGDNIDNDSFNESDSDEEIIDGEEDDEDEIIDDDDDDEIFV